MQKLRLSIIFSVIVLLFGCASGSIKDNQIESAITTEMENDMPIDIENKAAVVDNSQTSKSELGVKGDRNNINDSKMITDLNNKVLETYKELTNKYIWLLRYIIMALFLLIGKYELQIRKINNRLLDSAKQDDDWKEKMIEKRGE